MLVLATIGLAGRAVAEELSSLATEDLGLVGGPDAVWVYQYRVEGEHDLRVLRFAYRLAGTSKPRGFRSPRGVDAVAGNAAADRRNQAGPVRRSGCVVVGRHRIPSALGPHHERPSRQDHRADDPYTAAVNLADGAGIEVRDR